MSRGVDAALQTYMQGRGLHMTRLCKLGPLLDGSYRYLAFLDRDVVFGGNTYIARTGAQMSDFVSTSDLSVDNAEMDSLAPVDAFPLEGVTTEQIQMGALDSVPFVIYAVNYLDPTMGSFIWAAGTIGEVRMPGTSLMNFEQRSLTNKLLQTIGDVDSSTCRAKRLGTQYWDTTDDPRMEEQFPCLYEVEAEDVTGTISNLDGDEPDLLLYASGLSGYGDDYFAPGSILFTDGPCEGIEREIDAWEDNGTFALKNALPQSPEVGDGFRIRRECSKWPIGHNSCQTFWGTSWVLHFRGEPYIPVADASASLIPGAGVHTDIGGTGEPLPDNDPGEPSIPPGGGGAGNSSAGTYTSRTVGATVVDPDDYGADPTGVANSDAAFNAAYAALPGGGGIVRPGTVGGTYKVRTSQALCIKPLSNTRLDMLTNQCTLQAAYTSTPSTGSAHQDMIRVLGKNNVEIWLYDCIGFLDDWLDAGAVSGHGGGTNEWSHGLYIGSSSSAVTVLNSTIRDCVGDAISIGFSASDVEVVNSYLTRCRRQGVSSGGDNITIRNCELSYIGGSSIAGTSPQAGIDIEVDNPSTNQANNVLIEGCWSHHNAGPGFLGWTSCDNVEIRDSLSEYNSIGVHVNATNNWDVHDNTIRHNRSYGVRMQGGSTNTSINDNTFWDNSTGSTPDTTVESSSNITGMTSATSAHLYKTSDSTASVGTNTYQQ